MQVHNLKETCGGCPTVYEWTNSKGNNIYFRLRHGYARIVNETKDKTIIEGTFPYGDGICTWDEIVTWAKENSLNLNIYS